MRAATAALPHEHPKLAVTTLVNVGDFADQLEKAVERSRKVSPTMIEGNVISTEASDTASNTKTLNGKPTIIDRRYRKW
jgi:cytochrome oxidase Cu insertion factor (SCO1/SenC/PrrC family)